MSTLSRWMLSIALSIVVVFVAYRILGNDRSEHKLYTPSITVVPHEETVLSGSVVVQAGNVVYYRVPTTGSERNIRLTGHFLALGGEGNDIEAVLAEETEFGKWMNGQVAQVFYGTGKVTTGQIDIVLPTKNATYYLAFNNKFSVVSNKTVTGDVKMTYSTLLLKE